MARLWSSGFELNTTTSGVELINAFNTVGTSVVRSGNYANITTESTASRAFGFQDSSAATRNEFFRVYLNISTLPTNTTKIMGVSTGSTIILPTTCPCIKLTSAGVVQLFNGTSQVGSDGPTLSSGVWYRIELHYDSTLSAGSQVLEARVDGVNFAASSTLTLQATSYQTSLAGANIGAEAITPAAVLNWDDIAVNDSTGSFQNSWPGDGKIIHLRPNAAGDNTGLTTGVSDNTNHYLNIDEVTPDDDTSYNQTSSASLIDDYNLDASGLNTYDTVNVVQVGVRYRKVTSGTMVFNVRAKASAGGTVEASSNISSATTTFRTNAEVAPFRYPLTMYDLPGASTTPWTSTELDTAQIGVETVSNTANNWRVTSQWMLVDYTPGTPPPSTNSGFFGLM